ncbi:MAG: Coenzyme A biosynthesis bifunctional protein CoaBC [Planctomycetes bacterium ADurb.Bin401]|nr:MAG: Coenzyme A biosynthesis bifunctional protein CoaBC [Planctomycetes bacterium ADurb.Bin401]
MKANRLHFLITAGGTREYIDPVRFITNASSGIMGCALANAALKAGHRVTLISTLENAETLFNSKYGTHYFVGKFISVIGRDETYSPSSRDFKNIFVESAEDMFKAVKANFKKCDCLIMAAAVSDYTPAKKSKIKIKKSKESIILKLKPTTDILKWAGEHKRHQFVVGFALEDRNLRKNAEKKMQSKNLDMIIANSPSAIGSEKSTVQIKRKNSDWRILPKADKSFLAKRIINLLAL